MERWIRIKAAASTSSQKIHEEPLRNPHTHTHTPVTSRHRRIMKNLVALLLLCLCVPGHSDCPTDCSSCSKILPKLLNFNPMVCLIECDGSVSPSFSWDLCLKTLPTFISSRDVSTVKRSQEEAEALFPKEEEQMEDALLLPVALQRFQQVARALQQSSDSQNALSLDDEYDEEEEEAGQEGGDVDVAAGQLNDAAPLSISKRFGGFVKGRHGYRRLMSPGRSYQKRYGGFVGIRKSARKWNNQKRFSEFLKQYLGMSARATEFNSVSDDLAQQNEV